MINSLKLLVIGLDGADFRILNPLIDAGYLPNLGQCFAKSQTTPLLSTIPPITALAWPSFMTGLNPGKHGILGWQKPLNEDLERPLIASNKIDGAMIWHYLNAMGHKVCMANVPVTYPPQPLEGIMVSGMMTPSVETQFTYPKSLKDELLNKFPQFNTDIDIQTNRRHRYNHAQKLNFLQEVKESTNLRGQSFRWLLQRDAFDSAVVVFEVTDRLQHLYWDQISKLSDVEGDDEKAIEIKDALLACYQQLDQEIGDLLTEVSDDTYVIFLSDHGFGPITENVHLNDWLQQKGWLQYSQLRAGGWNILRQVGKRFKQWIPGRLIDRTKNTIPLYRTFDWSKTVAYSGLPSEYGVFLNCKDREPHGVVLTEAYEKYRNQIIEELKNWKHPDHGTLIMKAVYRREDVYSGEYLRDAPDIIFELNRGFYISDLNSSRSGELFSDISFEGWGFHERPGIFSIHGPGIELDEGKMTSETYIEDVLPTILYALDVPISNALDGKVLEEAFSQQWLAQHPILYGDVENLGDHVNQSKTEVFYSEEDEALIANRLKNLGYLSE